MTGEAQQSRPWHVMGVVLLHEGGGAQVPSLHVWLGQSAFPLHVVRYSHAEQLPPQSTEVSLPFFTPSAHDAAAQ